MSDLAPPVLTDVSLPHIVQQGETFQVVAHAADAGAGVKNVTIDLDRSLNTGILNLPNIQLLASLDSFADGTSIRTIDTSSATAGEYKITGVSVSDIVGNTQTATPASVGLPQSIIITSGNVATAGNDVLADRTALGSVMSGEAGNDQLFGEAGDDTLVGGTGADVLSGGTGTDTASYEDSVLAVNVTINGLATGGDALGDTMSGIENLRGGGGADKLTGDAGVNVLEGLAGNDTLIGGLGNDILDGGADSDTADYTAALQSVTVNLSGGTASGADIGFDSLISIENASGSAAGDQLTGDGNNNALSGNGGDDLLTGGSGNDQLSGGTGNDTLIGGAGADTLTGAIGNDTASYEGSLAGVSVTINSFGHFGDAEGDVLSGIENLRGSDGNDKLSGDANNNRLEGMAGNDELYGGLGNDILDGGAGTDVASYFGSATSITVNLNNGVAQGIGAEIDTLISIENVIGGVGDDFITGDALDNIIEGNAGADAMVGGDGIDTASYVLDIFGVTVHLSGSGTSGSALGDTLSGFENLRGGSAGDSLFGDVGLNLLEGFDGNDHLDGGLGNDILDGGIGSDTADYAAALQAVTANLGGHSITGADVGTDTLISIENVTGGAGGDLFFGDDATNILIGGDGNDTLVGNADIFAQQADSLIGGNGDDTLYGEFTDTVSGSAGHDVLYAVNDFAWTIDLGASGIEYMRAGFDSDHIDATTQTASVEVYGGGGDDVITGSGFDDYLWAGVGNDSVSGGVGDDMLFGDLGSDSLSGGDGNDRLYVDSTDTLIDGGAGFDALYIAGGSGMNIDMAAAHLEWAADLNGGADTLDGAGLAVRIEAYAGGGNDIVTGGAGDDFLWGEAGDDIITGNGGTNILVGGTGADVMSAGAGLNHFYLNTGGGGDGELDRVVFGAGWGSADITDFVHGEDKIDFTALGTDFSSLTITASFGHATIEFGADFVIVVGNGGLLTVGDFIF